MQQNICDSSVRRKLGVAVLSKMEFRCQRKKEELLQLVQPRTASVCRLCTKQTEEE